MLRSVISVLKITVICDGLIFHWLNLVFRRLSCISHTQGKLMKIATNIADILIMILLMAISVFIQI